MAFQIDYCGASRWLLSEVLKTLSDGTYGGEWYVEIDADRGGPVDEIVGRVNGVEEASGPHGRYVTHVVLDEVDKDYVTVPDGKTFTVDIETIARVVIP